VEVQTKEDGILDAPGAGLVLEERKLGRQVGAVGFDVLVDAASIGGEDGTVGGRQCSSEVVREAAHAKFAGVGVELERGSPHDFGEFAGGGAPEEIHLPHAILGGGISLGKDDVVDGGGFDARNAVGVAGDRGRGG
jgi:hypothetical protein